MSWVADDTNQDQRQVSVHLATVHCIVLPSPSKIVTMRRLVKSVFVSSVYANRQVPVQCSAVKW